jgi:hypothetical protein
VNIWGYGGGSFMTMGSRAKQHSFGRAWLWLSRAGQLISAEGGEKVKGPRACSFPVAILHSSDVRGGGFDEGGYGRCVGEKGMYVGVDLPTSLPRYFHCDSPKIGHWVKG